MAGIGREIKVPPVEEVPRDLDPALKKFLDSLAYVHDIREGKVAAGRNLRFVTIQDLIDAGVIQDGDIK